ncbi:AIR synthase-related protein [Paraliomyxa miuraensis]|uniref:AIR synthase-related protein n=1 Tax=Paraliomyxa miuraensis TaxID=376150 RepID=UPI00224E06F5|nr:AIR synthase-related protein [Paraliomyxa miuraensis]MCX4246165.1 AIR synthase-related protein [Paraliomyxa miuraensis]
MSSGRLPPGKVPWEVVARHLGDQLPDQVLLGPAAGEDAALVRLGDETWAIASDPISFGAPDAGRLAVIVNANDVAVRGARPRFFLAVILIAPAEAEPSQIGKVLDDVRTTCRDLDVALLGGHTEVTPGIDHSIVVGTMLGRVQARPIRTGDLEPGDRIGLLGSAGLEGSAILLDRFRDRLEALHGRDAFADLDRLLHEDWLLVAPAALAAAACPGVHSLHDVTEGGVGEALHELGRASGLELDVDPDRIPVLEGTRRLCADLGLDPLGLIGSGALLLGCQEESVPEVERRLEGQRRLTWIGRAGHRGTRPVARFERDELLAAGRLEGTRAVLFDLDGTLAEPIPGASELLTELREAGIAVAIVTSDERRDARALVERFGLPHDLLVTGDDGSRKPPGAPLLMALGRLGVPLTDSASVGHSVHDLHAARAAGIPRICHVGRHRPPGPERPHLWFPDLACLRRGFALTCSASRS